MKKNEIYRAIFLGVIGFLLFGLIILMIVEVEHLQGNAKVITYTGIVRGATQRLVKNELYGVHDDSAIERLDSILEELKSGNGELSLTVIDDELYLRTLKIQIEYWETLKESIMDFRNDSTKNDVLYNSSEMYFNLANETVLVAELYSDGVAKKVKNLELIIIILLVLILLSLIWIIINSFKKNKYLGSITYIDVNTGLPNKRRCEEKLEEVNLMIGNKNICCFMFDLNNLKVINDTMGHQWGDQLILSFGSFLRRVSPSDMFVGRFGGDEFIGVYEDVSKEDIEKYINKLNEKAKNLNHSEDGKTISIQFAYGYACSLDYPDCSSQILMEIADKKMYENKQKMKGLIK